MNFKRILCSAVAAATMFTSGMAALPVSANNDSDVSTKDISDEMDNTKEDESKLNEQIRQFIYTNALKADVLYNSFSNGKSDIIDENGDWRVMVVYNYTHTDVRPAIEKFMKDNGLDLGRVIFNAVGKEHTDGEIITDSLEIYTLIRDYVFDNDLNIWDIKFSYHEYISLGKSKITIAVYSMHPECEQYISNYVKEKGIDESLVRYAWLDALPDNEITVLGDANSDGVKNVRDCAFIANALSKGVAERLPDTADYNKDGKKNVRDAAAISKDLASK